MTNLDQDIALFAFRYALGRKTYAVSKVCSYLKQHWDEFPTSDHEIIPGKIKTAIENDNAGMDMDVESWKEILELPS